MASTKLKGNLVNLGGKELNVGDNAPQTVVVGQDLSEIKVGGSQDKKQIILTVPSLDTAVCATQTRVFNEKAASLKDVQLTIVSMDLPFAMGRFCATEGIKNLAVGSDFRNKDFANNYGVLIADGALKGLTCRSVFIVDTNGKITYKQIVPEITQEPDYEDVLANI